MGAPVEQKAVYAAYKAINETPGVTPGVQMHPPEAATTVRVQDGYCGAKLDAQVLGQPFKPLGGGLLLEVPRY